MVSLCTSSPTNRVDCSMDPSPVPEAPRQTIRRDPRSSTHRDDGSPLQAGYGHEVFCGGFAPHKPLIRFIGKAAFTMDEKTNAAKGTAEGTLEMVEGTGRFANTRGHGT